MKRIFVCLAALFVFAASAHAAGIIVPAEERYSPYTGVLPACDDPGVLSTISDRFAQKEAEFWNSSIRLAGFDRIQRDRLSRQRRRPTFRAAIASPAASTATASSAR